MQKRRGKLEQRRVLEQITKDKDETDFNPPDALDGLLSQLPDKLEIISKVEIFVQLLVISRIIT